MDNYYTTDEAHQRSTTLMGEDTRQGRNKLEGTESYPLRAAKRSHSNGSEQPRKTLKAGTVIPWSRGSEHLNLEQDNE